MNKLAKQAMDAHGGLERWNRFTTLSAHLIQWRRPLGCQGQSGSPGGRDRHGRPPRREGFALALRFSRSKVALRTATGRDRRRER